MFIGEYAIKRDVCIMCHLPGPRWVMKLTTEQDEDEVMSNYYELVETRDNRAACQKCWRKIGAYIVRFFHRGIKPSSKRLKLLELLIKNNGRPTPTQEIVAHIYGLNAPYGAENVVKLVTNLRRNGYIIDNEWGRGYQLIAEPEIPEEVSA